MQLWEVRDAGVVWEDLDDLPGQWASKHFDVQSSGRFLTDGDILRFKENGDGFMWEVADRSFWNSPHRTYCAFVVSLDLLDLLGG